MGKNVFTLAVLFSIIFGLLSVSIFPFFENEQFIEKDIFAKEDNPLVTGATYEDFTTFTEVDEGADITVTATRTTWATMSRGVTSYVYKDYGVAHFGDFVHDIEVQFNTSTASSTVVMYAVTNGINEFQAILDGSLPSLTLYAYQSAGSYTIYLRDGASTNNDVFASTANTLYYVTVERAGTTATAKFYSDSARTNLLDTITVVCGTTTLRYLYSVMSRDNNNGGLAGSGFSQNFDINEVVSNAIPTITGEVPVNQSIGINLMPVLNVTCTDDDGDTMNATWWSNSSGDWEKFAENLSISSDTTIYQNNSNFSEFNTTYYWSVNLTDGNEGWGNETYHFTTNVIPSLSGVYPVNESTKVESFPVLHVTCTDDDGDTMNATWWSNSSGDWEKFAENLSISSDTTIYQNNSNFSEFNTTYYWSVNLTDGNEGWGNETYHFTTNMVPYFSEIFPVNGSVNVGIVPWLYVTCNDADGDTMTATWRSNWSGEWIDFATNSSVANGMNISSINGNFRSYDTIYWWSINVTDGLAWRNETYHFTTEITDNPLNYGVIRVYGTEYTQGEQGTIYAQVFNADETPANSADVYMTVWERASKYIDNQQMTYIENSNGCYHYNFTTPSNINVFMVDVNSSNPTAYGSGEFHVSEWSSAISKINDTIGDINDTVNYINNTLNYLNGTYFPTVEAKIDNIYTLLQNVDGNVSNLNLLVSSLYSLLNDTYNISYYLNNTVWAGYVASQLYNISNMTYNITEYINTTVNSINTTANSINSAVNNILTIVTSMDSNVTFMNAVVSNIDSNLSYINITTIHINSTVLPAIQSKLNSVDTNLTLVAVEVGNINSTVGYINLSWGGYNASQLFNISNMTYVLADSIENILLHVNTTVTTLVGAFEVRLTAFGEINPGDDYLAQVTIFDSDGSMKNADFAPTISLWDSSGNLIVNNIPMAWIATGQYTYSYTTAGGQPAGQWTTMTRTTIGGEEVKNIIYWELESNPPEVTLTIVDNCFPSIDAEISITNEGTGNQEYIYYWWITPRADGDLVDIDTVDSGSASKLIAPLDTFTTTKTLNVPVLGTYWYKVRVYWGTEWSAASAQFDAISGGGGAGGGGGAPLTRGGLELTVICVDDDWKRIPGVTVDIYEDGRFLGNGLTNETGCAVFNIPTSMDLSITATKEGYKTVERPISISGVITEVIQMNRIGFAEFPWLLLMLIIIGGIIITYYVCRKRTADVKKKRIYLG